MEAIDNPPGEAVGTRLPPLVGDVQNGFVSFRVETHATCVRVLGSELMHSKYIIGFLCVDWARDFDMFESFPWASLSLFWGELG